MKVNYFTLGLGLLGAAKLITNAFGLDLINDNEINAIVNGVAALLTVFGVYKNHHTPNK